MRHEFGISKVVTKGNCMCTAPLRQGAICEEISRLARLYAWCKKDGCPKLSEADTQALFVEPILRLAGWDTGNPVEVRRAGGDRKKCPQFDVEVYDKNGLLRLAIECKAIGSGEFKVTSDGLNEGAGAHVNEGKEKQKDGVGQLRRYCTEICRCHPEYTIPIFTNGYAWVIFDSATFAIKEKLGNSLPQNRGHVYANLDSTDFMTTIIKNICAE